MTAHELKKARQKILLDQVDAFLLARLSPTSAVQAARRHQRKLVLSRYYEAKKARAA